MKYDEMNVKIGQLLKKYRNNTHPHLTVRAVGEILDMNNSTVSKWESGENSITAKDLFRYLEILNVTPEQFAADMEKEDCL